VPGFGVGDHLSLDAIISMMMLFWLAVRGPAASSVPSNLSTYL